MYKSLIISLLTAVISLGAYAKPLSFTLEHHRLGQVTAQSWPDKYLLIAIGYTSCPDICPTTVMDMASAMRALKGKQDQVVPIFISVDPNRDTVENIGNYARYFDPSMVGVTGTDAQIRALASNLKASFGYTLEGKPVYPPLPSNYEVFHSTYFYLYGPDRELIDVYGYGHGGDKIGQAILSHLP